MEIDICRLGVDGEGVGKLDNGKVAFVKGALVGEKVDADLISEKKNFAVAKLNRIIVSSENRVKPICKYFGVCGGCNLQHMSKPCEDKFKLDMVSSTISKVSKLNVDIDKIVTGKELFYRNKMVFPVVEKNGTSIVGMFEEKSHKIVDIDFCYIANEDINKFLKLSKEFFKNSNFSGYNFEKSTGDIMYLVVRANNSNILVTVVAKTKIDLKDYYDFLVTHFKSVGLSLILNDNLNEILSGKYVQLYGTSSLNINEFGINYHLDNRGFLQVNDQIKKELYLYVLGNIDKNENVIDCYSGAGLLSAIISKNAKSVIGIEIVKSASESAKNLAKENDIQNIEFLCGDVKEKLIFALKKFTQCSIVLDPPRSGCERIVLNNLLKQPNNAINKIIYISCNPSTLARDLKILSEDFEIESCRLFDIFARTSHVETVVILKKKHKSED